MAGCWNYPGAGAPAGPGLPHLHGPQPPGPQHQGGRQGDTVHSEMPNFFTLLRRLITKWFLS